MPERKYKYHISGNLFGKRSNQAYFRDELVGTLCNSYDVVKHYQKTEKNWKRELKYLKKQKKMLYIMENNYGARSDLKKINKLNNKASKKRSYSIRDRSVSDSD